MITLFRGELSKTLSTSTLFAFLLGGVGFSILNVVVVAVASGTLDEVGEKEEALSCLPILVLVWGLVGAAGEYRHRTAAPAALVARHGRGTLLLARLSAYAVTGLALGVLMTGAALALGLPLLSSQPGPDLGVREITSVVAGNLAACMLSAILGAAAGALVRNQIVGVVVLLVVNFAVIPLVAGAQEALTNLTPFGAASVLSRMTHDTTLSVAAAAAVLAAWTVLVAAAALISEPRRDLA
jgi:ABC-2 type transport system permease protein